MLRAGEPWNGGSDKPSSLQASRALCKTKLGSAKDLGLPQRAWAITRDFFPCLFVCIYLLSFHVESFGQGKMQGHTEEKQDSFRH